MKKMISCLLVGMVTAAMLLSGCGNSSASAGNTKSTGDAANNSSSTTQMHLIAAAGTGATHALQGGFYDPVMQHLEEATGGAVTYDMYTGGELVAMTKEIDSLRQNTCDIALSLIPMYDSARFPLTAVHMLPVNYIDEKVASEAWKAVCDSDVTLGDTGKTYMQLEGDDNSLKLFVCPLTASYNLCMHNTTLESLGDFNADVRVRTGSTASEIFTENLGLSHLSIPGTECYDALSKNSMEGIMMPADWIDLGITELLDTVYDIYGGTAVTYIAIDLDKWNSWPEDVQKAFEESIDACWESGIEARSQVYDNAWKALEDEGGKRITLADLPQDVQDKYAEATVATWYDWIDSVEADGHPGKDIAILWRDELVKAGGQVPEELMSLEDYTPNAK